MRPTFRAPLATLCGLMMLAGCGTAPASQEVAPLGGDVEGLAGKRLTDDSDLSGVPKQGLSLALKREGKAEADGTLRFPTKTLMKRSSSAPVSGRGDALRVVGEFRIQDFDGKAIGAANATVLLNVEGGLFGGSKAVGSAVTDAQGRWSVELSPDLAGKKVTVAYELGNARWKINKYRWDGPVIAALGASNDTGVVALEAGTQNAQAGLIHIIWNRALAAFEREAIPLDWWSRQIGTNWPANGDYFSMNTVNLTDAKQWDVNGHEIGHAMFFNGFNSAGGGGPHKIDECYGADLAWSEGFASFFSLVISARRDDPDAKFEFMVPRRKPIRFENVPADVCEGHTNEWRVGAAVWDLYDTHADGTDNAALEFKTIWGALVKTNGGPRMGNALDAFERIAAKQPAAARATLAAAFAQSGVPVAAPRFAKR